MILLRVAEEDATLIQTLEHEQWEGMSLERANQLIEQFEQRYDGDQMQEVQQSMLDDLYAGRGCSIQAIAVAALGMPFASHTILPILQERRSGFQSFAELTGDEKHDVSSNHRKSIGNVLWIHPWSSASGRAGGGMRLHPPEHSNAPHWHNWLLDEWSKMIEDSCDCSHDPSRVRPNRREEEDQTMWTDLVLHKLHFLYVVAYAATLTGEKGQALRFATNSARVVAALREVSLREQPGCWFSWRASNIFSMDRGGGLCCFSRP